MEQEFEIRKATLEDVPKIMSIIHKVVPMMHAAGNFQWDASYPSSTNFENDIMNENLYVASFPTGVICGVVAITEDQGVDYCAIAHWRPDERSIVPHRYFINVIYDR